MNNQRYYNEYNDWTEHERATETVNDKISEDVDNTMQEWLDDGYLEMNPEDILNNLDPKNNLKIRYVTNEMLCRKGGILTAVIDEDDKQFLRVKNNVANVCWSVQIYNIYKLFYKPIANKTPKIKEPSKPRYTEQQIEAAIEESIEQTGSRNADKNYKYIKEHLFIDIPRQKVRDYFSERNV